MTTGLQLAILGGLLIGLGVSLLLWRLVPAQPDLADVVQRYSPEGARQSLYVGSVAGDRTAATTDRSPRDRLGLWAMRHLPANWWGQTPTKELALLQRPVHRHNGQKVSYALLGLILPPGLSAFFQVLGFNLPVLIPLGASIALAVFMWFVPDIDVRTEAKRARTEFTRALGSYIDLVALERANGSGARQAMELAAGIGDGWVFRRLGEELARSRWSGLAPWDALHALADELALPELDDLADIMRLSQEGSQVYSNLRARSQSLRSAMLSEELGKANAVAERMSIPMSLLGVVFMAILVAPALLRVMVGGGI